MIIQRVRDFFAAVFSLRLLTAVVRRLLKAAGQNVELQRFQALANAEREYRRFADACRDVDPRRLEHYGMQQFSQNDEDGILAEIFRRIGTTNHTFVEFGVKNGTECNTVSLLIQGWNGLWIDGSTDASKEQQRVFRRWVESGNLRCANQLLTRDNIDSVITSSGVTGEIDLLSIDVDGNDLTLWQAITCVKPRVVVIEYNGWIAPPVQWCLPYDPKHVWDGQSIALSASLEAMTVDARKRGYELVACNIIGLNAFFVRSDLCEEHFASDRSPLALYHPRRYWLDMIFRRNTNTILRDAIDGIPN